MAHASNHSLAHGWIDSPDNRGTIDIIWSCLGTLFLCSWVVLCLNVPAADEGYWRIFARKLRWMCLAIYGPEFILVHAMGQWYSARMSVRAFRSLNHEDWTLRHAFFADMGGFVLATPDDSRFLVNAFQIHYLVQEGCMPFPRVPLKAIDDKDKADGFARLIVVLQTVWFVSKCIGRAAQGLAITTFELTTLAFVFCTLATFFCWRHKPLDVDTPIVLHVDTALTEIHQPLRSPGPGLSDFAYLDLPDTEYVECFTMGLRHLGLHSTSTTSTLGTKHASAVRPRMPNDRLPLQLDTLTMAVMLLIVSSYAAVHLLGWNFFFPSPTERLLWRLSSATMFGTTIIFWAVDRAALYFHNSPSATDHTHDIRSQRGPSPRSEQLQLEPLSSHPQATQVISPSAGLPETQHYFFSDAGSSPWVTLALALVGVAYTSARLYLLVECFVGLRAVPTSAFEEVRWGQFWPHL